MRCPIPVGKNLFGSVPRRLARFILTDHINKEEPVQHDPSKNKTVTENKTKELADAGEGEKWMPKYFGLLTNDSITSYINQAIRAHPDSYNPKAKDAAKEILPSVMGINPKGDIECMLVIQAIGVHNLSMERISRAALSDRTDIIDSSINQATKLSRTFVALIEALNKHRGKGQQKMTVKHVHVNELPGGRGGGDHPGWPAHLANGELLFAGRAHRLQGL